MWGSSCCSCMCMRGRTHTSFVGEESSGNTVTDRFSYSNTSSTAEYGIWLKCTNDDLHKCSWNRIDIQQNNDQASNNIDTSHDRNDLLNNSSQSCSTAYEDEACQHCQNKTDGNRRDIDISCCKYFCKCSSNGIGLYHISHESKCEDNEDREEYAKHFSKSSFECSMDIVDRTSSHFPMFYSFVFLSQGCLSIDSCHSEKSTEPHPEDGTRTASY